jgi:hypothetical protein
MMRREIDCAKAFVVSDLRDATGNQAGSFDKELAGSG